VTDLVASERRLYPVGRLDADSTGLILLTNDGELANRLTHPRYGVPKTYRAQLRGRISDRDIERLATGVKLEDGPTAPAEARRIGPSEIEITIREGRNRQVRRMLQRVGNEIASLQRVGFASLTLGDLPLGEARELSRSEVKRLWKDAGPVKASGDKPR
jgi:23S rRNA pseudouridine2605 synthase